MTNRPLTRILEATPSALTAAGIIASESLHIIPIATHRGFDDFSFIWTTALALLGVVSAVFSLLNQTRKALMTAAVLKLALGFWVIAVGAAILGRPVYPPGWLATREWTLVGAVWALGVYFINSWWVVVHFRLPALEGQVELRRQLDEVHHEPKEEGRDPH
jgi:hypothetical protein